jgi:uncharacterized protein with PQ loop repeat
MSNINWLDLLGYLGTFLVVLSFTFKNVNTLRKVSVVACVIWVLYGIFKNDIPIVVTNVLIMVINLYSLVKNRPTKSSKHTTS